MSDFITTDAHGYRMLVADRDAWKERAEKAEAEVARLSGELFRDTSGEELAQMYEAEQRAMDAAPEEPTP